MEQLFIEKDLEIVISDEVGAEKITVQVEKDGYIFWPLRGIRDLLRLSVNKESFKQFVKLDGQLYGRSDSLFLWTLENNRSREKKKRLRLLIWIGERELGEDPDAWSDFMEHMGVDREKLVQDVDMETPERVEVEHVAEPGKDAQNELETQQDHSDVDPDASEEIVPPSRPETNTKWGRMRMSVNNSLGSIGSCFDMNREAIMELRQEVSRLDRLEESIRALAEDLESSKEDVVEKLRATLGSISEIDFPSPTVPLPELSRRLQIRTIMTRVAKLERRPIQDVYRDLYEDHYFRFGVDLYAKVEELGVSGASKLDAAEHFDELENLYACAYRAYELALQNQK